MKKSLLPIAAAALLATPAISAQRQALRIPAAGSTGLHYELRIDDAILGEHPQSPAIWWNERDDNGVITGDDHRLRSHTVSAWVRRGSGTSGRILGLTLSDRYQISSLASYYVNFNSQLRFRTSSWAKNGGTGVTWTAAEVRTSSKITQDDWTFITAVIDDENCLASFYADGMLLGTQQLRISDTHYGIGLYYLDSFFTFGHSDLNLDIDEVQIWDHALTADEVKRSAAIESTSASGLLGMWRFAPGSNSFANIAVDGKEIPAVLVQGTTRTSGVKYYENITTAEIEPEFTEGHQPTEVTLAIEQPTQGGTLSVAGSTFNKFSEVNFEATATEGWQPKSFTLTTGDFTETLDGSARSFVICGNATLTAEFTDRVFATCNQAAHGTVTVTANDEPLDFNDGKVWLDKNTDLTFTLVPDDKYAVESFMINGVEHKADISADGSFSITAAGNIEAQAKFRYNFAVLSVKSNEGGTVSVKSDGSEIVLTNNGTADVNLGQTLVFTLTPNLDHIIWDATVNSTSRLNDIDAAGQFEVAVETDTVDVDITFHSSSVDLSYTAMRGGNVSLSIINGNESTTPQVLESGKTQVPARGDITLTITPESNDCTLDKFEINGADMMPQMADNKLDLRTAGNDLNLSHSFDIRSYAFEIELEGADAADALLEDPDHGTIYQSLNTNVLSGSHVTLTLYLTDDRFEILSVSEDDANYEFSHGSEDGYKTAFVDFGYIAEPHNIKVVVGEPASVGTLIADSQLSVNGLEVSSSMPIEVYDIAGAKVAGNAVGRFSLEPLAPGAYIVRSGNSAIKVIR